MAKVSLTGVALGLAIASMVLPSSASFASCRPGPQLESCRKAEQNMMKRFRQNFADASKQKVVADHNGKKTIFTEADLIYDSSGICGALKAVGTVKTFHANGAVRSVESCAKAKKHSQVAFVRHGDLTAYYPDGSKRMVAKYWCDFEIRVNSWDPTGKPIQEADKDNPIYDAMRKLCEVGS